MNNSCRFILVFFCMLTALSAARLPAEARIEDVRKENYFFSSGGSLSLFNFRGPVKLFAWDKEECELVAVKTFSGEEKGEEARKWLEKVKIQIKKEGDRIEICTVYPEGNINVEGEFNLDFGEGEEYESRGIIERLTYKLMGFLGGVSELITDILVEKYPVEVAYELKLPRRTDVTVKTIFGDLELEGLDGEISVNVIQGMIEMKSLSGKLKGQSVNGDFNLIDPAGRVEANTVNGSITARLGRMKELESLRSGTINGNMTFELPEDADATVKLSAVNGEIEIREGLSFKGKIRSKKVEGVFNQGGPKLEGVAINGWIELKAL
ncbi:MAG TPA: hypothetical protein VM123_12555 [archaeon]|nr:hypothetical protein [archaeon]